jgi:hypothetical protein
MRKQYRSFCCVLLGGLIALLSGCVDFHEDANKSSPKSEWETQAQAGHVREAKTRIPDQHFHQQLTRDDLHGVITTLLDQYQHNQDLNVVLHNRDTDRTCEIPYPLYLVAGKFHVDQEPEAYSVGITGEGGAYTVYVSDKADFMKLLRDVDAALTTPRDIAVSRNGQSYTMPGTFLEHANIYFTCDTAPAATSRNKLAYTTLRVTFELP